MERLFTDISAQVAPALSPSEAQAGHVSPNAAAAQLAPIQR